MKIYQYLRLHIKIICRRFRITKPFAFEIYAPKIYEMFIYEHTEITEYVKPTFLGLKTKTFQGIVFIWSRSYSETLKSALVSL